VVQRVRKARVEVAGTVVACGARVTAWEPGDRVFGIVGGGGLATRVRVHERCVARVPDALRDRDAAAIPEAFLTAHDAVRTQAQLRPGEVLLVHGAGGGVGTAAVQIGVLAGSRVLAVARSRADDVRALGAEVIAPDGFAAAVADATDRRGADVILELVGGPNLAGNLEAVAVRGRIVIVGVGAGGRAEVNLGRLMQRRASIRGTVLRARPLEEKASVVRAFETEVLPALAAGRVRAVVDRVFAATDVHAAFDHLDAPGKFGKVLVDFGTDA